MAINEKNELSSKIKDNAKLSALIHDNLEFHNVAQLVEKPSTNGVRLQRVPESVREHVDEGTAGVMLSPATSEIRFRFKEGCDSTVITLSSDGGAVAYVYLGPFQAGVFKIGNEPTEIKIAIHKRLKLMTEEQKQSFTYHPDMARICFGEDYPEPITYHGNSGGVCLPNENDKPKKLMIAYGSSITHGTGQSGAALSYPAHTAYKLNMEVRNLGASGCCLCEPELADYLAEQECDVITLELSVNMLGRGISAEEFSKRAEYLVRVIADADPNRPVVCITIFPHYNDMGSHLEAENQKATSEEYRQVLRDIVSGLNRPNISLIEGPQLLKSLEGLRQDLIHPGARGSTEIGENLASKLESILGK
jgi:lysophospholipase L1-like esterase